MNSRKPKQSQDVVTEPTGEELQLAVVVPDGRPESKRSLWEAEVDITVLLESPAPRSRLH